jgi:hypothetical protein
MLSDFVLGDLFWILPPIVYLLLVGWTLTGEGTDSSG